MRRVACPLVAALILGAVLASCGSSGASAPPPGPGGSYDVYLRCTPYSGDLCAGAQYPNYFQCDSRPGDPCVVAPGPSPDPQQTVWCCQFPCARGDPSTDSQCGGQRAYVCTDAKFDPATFGCRSGGQSSMICC